MRLDVHFCVSLASLICIIIIISHGAQLSAKVENSTIQVDNKISQFDSLMVLLKSQFQKIDDESKQMFADVQELIARLHDLSLELELKIHMVENSTQQSLQLCQNETFVKMFYDYSKTLCF